MSRKSNADQAKPEAVNAAPAVAAEDDFLSCIRLDQSYTEGTFGVRKPLMTVPIRKPLKTDFFRVHPDHFLDVADVELREENEHYFAAPHVAQVIAEFTTPVRLRFCVTRQGTAFLWPVKLITGGERRTDAWRRSAADAAKLAEAKWIRIAADMNLGAYQAFEAIADLGEPRWPAEPWIEVLKVALRDRLIESEDHSVVRQLLGQA